MKRAVLVIVLFLIFQPIADAGLLEYVAKEDPSGKWEKLGQQTLPTEALKFELKFTSQTWKDIPLEHRLTLIKPKDTKDSTLVFLIIVGSWGKDDSDEMNYGTTIASGISAPVAILYDVPYQPLFNGLREDRLIAYTFTKMLETGDEEWALLLPMTKTAVRAMDTIEEFLKKELNVDVSGFVVAGASKRGWTTWLSSAVDRRVKGICPMVYDNLNLVSQMDHQVETWGRYSEQINDYTERDLPQQIKTEKGRKLASLVDPYTYKDHITVPKLIVVGSNDRYWPLDAMNLYFDELVGEKYILRVPNRGHDVNDMQRVIGDAIAFFRKVNGDITFPVLSWDFKESGDGLELSISSDVKPAKVSIWTANAPTKDFRDVVWQEAEVTSEDSRYNYTLKKPQQGYSAIFGEAVYASDKGEFFLSTGVRIVGPGEE